MKERQEAYTCQDTPWSRGANECIGRQARRKRWHRGSLGSRVKALAYGHEFEERHDGTLKANGRCTAHQ